MTLEASSIGHMTSSTKNLNGSLHHVEINVSNLEVSRSFYTWFLLELGYTLFQTWPKGFSYKKDETYLVFVQTEEKYLDKTYHRSSTGLNHLAFHCDKALIDRLTTQVKEKGIPILYADRHPYANGSEAYALFFEDPDRLKIECAAY
jgi:catechol 2,3-dioxygenase-like lactoylglutathione lyase family enzyme